ncbi:alpha/beta hydrolase family protein [Patiriisocius sp. Uisw_017]|jgi:pimeloyl-ACP methyl ester carboxylesterase|uniref:alpha/beta hydrolase family protein n=1 Tax=Patiriisocius sp. Uisw_017 TaxID=3230968 RepID=UPI0039EBBE8A
MMQIKKNNVLRNSEKKPILYDVYFNKTNTTKPIVIFCHGYKGFKDWGAWELVAEYFANEGFFFLKFNFSHNGSTLEEPIDFPDLEAFSQNNYTKELDDLEQIITHISSTKQYDQETNTKDINLIGHSRGGGIVLIKAEENTGVKKVITWAGVSDYKSRFNIGSDLFNNWKSTGRFYVTNGRTKQEMPHDWQFFQDFITNENRLTIQRAAEVLKKPLLIIHGIADPTVSIDEAKKLQGWTINSRTHFVENANHVFGASHPWDTNSLPNHLEEVVKKSCEFLK